MINGEDFDQDGTPDMAVFDAGVYATAESTGYGNPPQLLLSRPDFTHELSSALADAVAAHRHSLGPDLPGEPFTGRHVQVLINQGGMEFRGRDGFLDGRSVGHPHPGEVLPAGPRWSSSTATNAPTLWCRAPAMIIRSSTAASASASRCRTVALTTNNGYAADVNGDGAVDFVSLPGGTDVEVLLNRQ